jgi:glutamyl-tRNA reductase
MMSEISGFIEMMRCVVLGVSHSTANSDVRDTLALKGERGVDFSRRVLEFSWCKEVVVLSTCNRTEIYAVLSVESAEVQHELTRTWCEFTGASHSQIQRFTYYYTNTDSVHHLYRVVSSLESLVVGEGQILGQVKEAFFRAQRNGFVGLYTNHLFQTAFALGKSVRSDTAIGRGAVSIAYAAVELCKRVFDDLSDSCAAVVGTGEMGALSVLHLKQAGVNQISFVNRTIENAVDLGRKYQASVYPLQRLDEVLEISDIVISATGSPHYVITARMVELALKRRRGRPMVLVDIAAPRDIDPKVNEISEVFAFCLDDLEEVVRANRNKRLQAARAVEDIISQKLSQYIRWHHGRRVVPVIKGLKQHLCGIAENELAKHRGRFNRQQLEAMEDVLHGVAGKWLHHPLEELKSMSDEGTEHEASALLNRLFQLQLDIEHESPPRSDPGEF